MAGFEGIWNITESTIKGSTLIGGNPPQIKIKRAAGGSYQVTIPLKRGDPPWVFVAFPNDQALSRKDSPIDGDGNYGVRLVFNRTGNPTQIVEGPLGSLIERWPHKDQPEDMGTITGTKGL